MPTETRTSSKRHEKGKKTEASREKKEVKPSSTNKRRGKKKRSGEQEIEDEENIFNEVKKEADAAEKKVSKGADQQMGEGDKSTAAVFYEHNVNGFQSGGIILREVSFGMASRVIENKKKQGRIDSMSQTILAAGRTWSISNGAGIGGSKCKFKNLKEAQAYLEQLSKLVNRSTRPGIPPMVVTWPQIVLNVPHGKREAMEEDLGLNGLDARLGESNVPADKEEVEIYLRKHKEKALEASHKSSRTPERDEEDEQQEPQQAGTVVRSRSASRLRIEDRPSNADDKEVSRRAKELFGEMREEHKQKKRDRRAQRSVKRRLQLREKSCDSEQEEEERPSHNRSRTKHAGRSDRRRGRSSSGISSAGSRSSSCSDGGHRERSSSSEGDCSDSSRAQGRSSTKYGEKTRWRKKSAKRSSRTSADRREQSRSRVEEQEVCYYYPNCKRGRSCHYKHPRLNEGSRRKHSRSHEGRRRRYG
jgi:hypothetical protein